MQRVSEICEHFLFLTFPLYFLMQYLQVSQYEHDEFAGILLKHGTDPNAKDNRENTALHYAVWHSNTSMAARLLVHHANISIWNELETTQL